MRLLALLVFSTLLSALLSAAEPKPGYDPIDWSASAPGAAGESTGELKDPGKGSSVMRYRIFAPATLPERKTLALVIAFHGMNGNEDSLTRHAHTALAEAGLDGGYVVAGGKSVGAGWADSDEESVLRFVDWLQTVYPIDKRRIFLWGYSNGGGMVGWLGGRHQDRFAGVVRYAGTRQALPAAKDPANTQTEYYLVHGDADPTVNVSSSRNFRNALAAQGYRYVYRELRGIDHNVVGPDAAVRQDAARWLDFLRHKSVAPVADDLAWLRGVANAKGDEAFAKPDTWTGLVRLGGPLAWPVVLRAVKSKAAAVRLSAAEACAHTEFTADETVAALAHLAEDDDAGVRSAAITALAVRADWRDQAAQLALGRIALARKKPADERLAAAKGLADALPLVFTGERCEDPALAEAVLALLAADTVELRTTAFTPLKAIVSDGLAYDPAVDSAEQRKAPLAAWRQWFDVRLAAADGKPQGKKK
jgi:dienelactone hydrolase